MERPTYTREQLQQLPAVVAKRQLEDNIKRTVSSIEANVVSEAKKGILKYIWHNQHNPQPDPVMDEICAQLRKTFKEDVDISHEKGNVIVDWST